MTDAFIIDVWLDETMGGQKNGKRWLQTQLNSVHLHNSDESAGVDDGGDDNDDMDQDNGDNLGLAQVLSIRKWVSHGAASKVQTNAGLMAANIMITTTTIIITIRVINIIMNIIATITITNGIRGHP